MKLPRFLFSAFAFIALVSLALSRPNVLRADEPKKIDLWPEGVPGLRADETPEKLDKTHASNVHHPYMLEYAAPADKAVGTAAIVCPGGSYRSLSIENEGSLVAERLNALGITAFVLHYRMVEYGHPAPLRDVLRAIRLLRSRAGEFGVKPDRVGIVGFSAGGHLAASAATLFDDPDGKTGAELDKVSGRPDFAALVYPVITMKDPYAHALSRKDLIGDHPTPEAIDHMSLELHVLKDAPPVFIVCTEADTTVKVENELMFYQALRNAGVPAELHIWPKGGHGFGMKKDIGEASTWTDRLEEWLRAGGFIAAPK